MNARSGKIISGGRLQIPARLRRELGLVDGSPVVMRVVDGALQIRLLDDIVADVQKTFRAYIPEGVSLVDELIAERRVEAAKE